MERVKPWTKAVPHPPHQKVLRVVIPVIEDLAIDWFVTHELRQPMLVYAKLPPKVDTVDPLKYVLHSMVRSPFSTP